MTALALPPSVSPPQGLQGTSFPSSSGPSVPQAPKAAPSAFPILDWSDWSGPSANAVTQDHFLYQLRDAAVGLGFFILRNSPLDQGHMRQDLFDLSSQFFKLPLEQRLALSITNSPHFRGYSKFADERTLGAVDNRDQVSVSSMAFHGFW